MATRETFDDVFDEDADEVLINEKEWKKVETDLKKDGYRDGLDSGQEVTLQTGFNNGYSQAVNIIQRFGQLRGKLSAHLSWRGKDPQDSSDIKSLLKKISEFEKQLISRVKQYTPENKMDHSKTIDGPSHSESSGGDQQQASGCDCEKTTCCSESNSTNACCETGASSGQREITPFSEQFYKDLETQASEKYEQLESDATKMLSS